MAEFAQDFFAAPDGTGDKEFHFILLLT